MKVIEDDLYIPLSSVFRTFKPRNYRLETNLAKKTPKSGVAEYKENATYVEFSVLRQHLSEYYVGLTEFMKAANSCRIGVEHESTLMHIRHKADTLFFLSRMLFRPNVVILEMTRSMLPRLRRIL